MLVEYKLFKTFDTSNTPLVEEDTEEEGGRRKRLVLSFRQQTDVRQQTNLSQCQDPSPPPRVVFASPLIIFSFMYSALPLQIWCWLVQIN